MQQNVLGTTNWREPSLVTGGADYTWNVALGAAKGQTWDTLEYNYKYMNLGKTSVEKAFNSYTEFGQCMNEQYSNKVLF